MDGSISSRELITVDRSNLTNNIWFTEEYLTGISASGTAAPWVYRIGIYSAGEKTREFGKFTGDVFTLGVLGYNFAKKLNVKILNVKDANEAMLALETDRADAYGHDDILLFGQRSKAKNPAQWEVVGDYLSYDPYSIMVRRDDSAMRLVANKTISYLFRSGEFEKIDDKWFTPLGVPMSELLPEGVRLQALPD